MNDEKYAFIEDVTERKSIARGAFHKKGGAKSNKCTLPSDYLTRKEREKMNGEVKTWNLNKFYTGWPLVIHLMGRKLTILPKRIGRKSSIPIAQ